MTLLALVKPIGTGVAGVFKLYQLWRIKRLLVGRWKGNMKSAEPQMRNREYEFIFHSSRIANSLEGHVIYEGRISQEKKADIRVAGFDKLTTLCSGLDTRSNEGRKFRLECSNVTHCKKAGVRHNCSNNTVNTTYNCTIISWFPTAQIGVEVVVGDEGDKLVGVWTKS